MKLAKQITIVNFMLRAVLLLRQPLDPPDIGKKRTNLLRYVLAILLGHESTGFVASFCRKYK